ncbi:MAG: hypothetical protein WD228_11805 [Mycobacterium sp.]
MAIPVRAHLLSGTAAILTATAITVGGVASTGPSLSSAHVAALADVELAALASPLLEIFDTIQKTNLYLFSIAEPPTTVFDRAGIVPDFLAAGFPILTQYSLNAPDYVNQAINYLFADFQVFPTVYPGALRILTWAAEALPANIGFAVQQIFSGNLVGALQTLQFATINPIQAALYQTLNAGLYALGGVGVRAAAVITAIAEWVPTTIRNLADDVTVVLNAAANVIGNVAFGLQTLNPETVWNAVVEGLLGTNPNPATPTIPDALINQTIGEGGRIYTIPGLPGFREVPSLRQNFIELRDNIADALATDVPIPDTPPFPVAPPPLGSQIPTPWNPTPAPPPIVAVAPLAATTAVSVAEPTAAAAPANDGPGSAAERTEPVAQPATLREDIAAVSGEGPAVVADKDRPARAGRGAEARADAPARPSRQTGARSAVS